VFVKVGLNLVNELCTHNGDRVGPCFAVFAKELRVARAEENRGLLEWGV